MPALSRWCVRCALVYLVVGMGVGSWLLIDQANGHAPDATWAVLHAHILLVGFLLLLIMGVAHWMFPRVHGTRVGRGGGWIAFALVNAGLILRVVAEPRVASGGRQPWQAVLEVAAVLPTVGIAVFAVTIMPRIRAAMTADKARELRARANRE